MGEPAYIITEGAVDAAILMAVLPAELARAAVPTPVGGRSSITSVARTLLVTRRRPVAVLFDADSLEEGSIQDRVRTIEELLGAVAGRTPTRVIPLVPTIESLFFETGVLTRICGSPLPDEVRALQDGRPREALDRLLRRAGGPNDIEALLRRLDDADKATIRATPPIRDLIAFLGGIARPAGAPPLAASVGLQA